MKAYYIVTLDIKTEHLTLEKVTSILDSGMGAGSFPTFHLEGIISLYPVTSVFQSTDASGELDRLSPLIDTLLAGIALGALFSAGIIYSKDSDSGCYLLTILVSTNNAEVTPDFLLNDCLSRSGTPAITYRGTQCLSQVPSPIDAFCLNEQGVVIVTDDRIRAAIQIHGKKMLMKNDANTIGYLIGTI